MPIFWLQYALPSWACKISRRGCRRRISAPGGGIFRPSAIPGYGTYRQERLKSYLNTQNLAFLKTVERVCRMYVCICPQSVATADAANRLATKILFNKIRIFLDLCKILKNHLDIFFIAHCRWCGQLSLPGKSSVHLDVLD